MMEAHEERSCLSRAEAVGKWWKESVPGGQFWRLASTVALFNAGVSVYLFLYNLFLLDLGLREQKIGVLVSATAIGSIASTIPMGMLARRLGLRRTLIATLVLLSFILGARACLVWYPAQLAFAFFTGAVLAGWVVCLSPAVAGVVEESKRPLAFSILFAIAVATGSVGGLGGANMPGLWQWVSLHYAAMPLSPLEAKRFTLLFAAALAALAAAPIIRLACDVSAPSHRSSYAMNPFLMRFLIACACWSAAIGLFNPFTTVYFSRYLHVPLPRLGMFFAIAQLAQTTAVLCAPSLMRRSGLVTGIVVVQVTTAASLALLSINHGTFAAVALYCGYMASQHMAEPGIQSLLMGQVAPHDRSGASALLFLVTSLTQAGTATFAGFALARFSYPSVIAGAAAAVLISAIVFRTLCASQSGEQPFAVVDVAPSKIVEA